MNHAILFQVFPTDFFSPFPCHSLLKSSSVFKSSGRTHQAFGFGDTDQFLFYFFERSLRVDEVGQRADAGVTDAQIGQAAVPLQILVLSRLEFTPKPDNSSFKGFCQIGVVF